MKEIKITPSGIKQAIDNLLNENELSQDKVYKQEDEIERLNNIINELEKYINEEYIYDELGMKIFDASELQDKLQELKGSDKECINCGRLRVEKYSDGTEICEKCNFDQNKKEYVLRGEDND